jgi:hypothetical protein
MPNFQRAPVTSCGCLILILTRESDQRVGLGRLVEEDVSDPWRGLKN